MGTSVDTMLPRHRYDRSTDLQSPGRQCLGDTDGPEAAGGTRVGSRVGVRLSATGTETLPVTVLAPLPHLANWDRKYEMVTCDLPPSPLSYI